MKKIAFTLLFAGLMAGAAAPAANADVIIVHRHHHHLLLHPGMVWVAPHSYGPFWHRHYVPGHWAPV